MNFSITFKYEHMLELSNSSKNLRDAIGGDAVNAGDIQKVADTLKRMAASMSSEIQEELKAIN